MQTVGLWRRLDLQAEPILGARLPVQGSTVDPDRAPCLTLHRGRGRVYPVLRNVASRP